jgi:hypothetical protein
MKKMIWKTFDEWSASGYLIIKGSKGVKVQGQWKFSNRQIKRKPINNFKFKTSNGNSNTFWGDSFDGHWENGSSSCGEECGYSPEMYG